MKLNSKLIIIMISMLVLAMMALFMVNVIYRSLN